MTLNLPSGCITEASRMPAALRGMELLRLEQNKQAASLSSQDLAAWMQTYFNPRQAALVAALAAAMTESSSGLFTVDPPWLGDFDLKTFCDIKTGAITFYNSVNATNPGAKLSIMLYAIPAYAAAGTPIHNLDGFNSVFSGAKQAAKADIFWYQKYDDMGFSGDA